MGMENKHRKLKLGDVVGVDHGYYQHFGIYMGDMQVIHYFPIDGCLEKPVMVQTTEFEQFTGGEEDCFICDFSKFYQPPKRFCDVQAQSKSLHKLIDPKLNLSEEFEKANCLYMAFLTGKYKLYSPQETMKRAASRLGETSGDLRMNNCEHFAIWCKTGIRESYQCNAIIKLLKALWIAI